MLVLNAPQVRAWDEFTIREEPIASIDLMERAAGTVMSWLVAAGFTRQGFSIFCGKGNNGGDGLAVARMLTKEGLPVRVNILEFGAKGTQDFQANLAKLHETPAEIRFISSTEALRPVPESDIIIDALFGTGLSRPVADLPARIIEHMNRAGRPVIAIDMPSGLMADGPTPASSICEATHTLSFQCYKPALLLPGLFRYTGRVHILDIGLHPSFPAGIEPFARMIDQTMAASIWKPRPPYAHKGQFGHAALMAGSYGMMGAAVLAARGVLRSGAGKLTCHIPACGYGIMQSSLPEAMCRVEPGDKYAIDFQDAENYSAIGIGPGIGVHDEQAPILEKIFRKARGPLVLDADGLNLVSQHSFLLKLLPEGSLITPHFGEFERMFGPVSNDFERISRSLQIARERNIIIILKGRHSVIVSPNGSLQFNESGNAGMATGGSGDVLTGILTGLLAQGYSPNHAAALGVYIHGRAGDLAAATLSQESLLASDISDWLGQAFREFY